MIKLKRNSGLDIKLDLDNLKLVFGKDTPEVRPLVRKISEMQEVLLDKKLDSPDEIYYTYRGIHGIADKEKILRNHLRYDITIIKPGFLGDEFMRTAGHYHVKSYPQLYEVLWGEALCLLQRPEEGDPRRIKDVVLIRAKAKEKILALPDYGHILINPSSDVPLVTANWISTEFDSDTLYKQTRGPAYFVTDDDGEFKFIKNDFFQELPLIRKMRPVLPFEQFGLSLDKPIYDILYEVDKLDFLNHPDKYSYDSCFK